MITGIFPALCADDVAATRDFYMSLFGFRVVFDSGWYVQLEAPEPASPQIGIVERTHDSVPADHQRTPAGVLVPVEVDDVDRLWAAARALGAETALELRDEPFGQRHFMVVDPAGTLVDVIQWIAPDAEYAALYAAGSGGPG